MSGESIIYFAKEWGQLPTSCDQVFRQLARQNKILWINSVATRKPNIASAKDLLKILKKLKRFLGGVQQVGPSSWVYQPLVVPLPHSEIAKKVNRRLLCWSILRQARKLGMTSPQLWSFVPNVGYVVGHLSESVAVYYCVDEWSEFSYVDREKMLAEEADLLRKVDVCFATASSLVTSKAQYNSNVFLASHGVDHEHFARALNPEEEIPEEILRIPAPRIVFWGQIHDWIDLNLIAQVAAARSDWSIVLIGDASIDLEPLRGYGNVYCLGKRPYESLPGYCKALQVAMIPFVMNELARHINPIKLREYLSAGLPVVSTKLPEVMQYGHQVYLAGTPSEFIDQIDRAIREDSEASRRKRSESMRQETWQAKVEEVGERVMQYKRAVQQKAFSSKIANPAATR